MGRKKAHKKTQSSRGSRLIPRILLAACGIAMLPLCAAVTSTVVAIIRTLQPSLEGGLPRPAIALAIGFFLWVSLYITMPRPIRTYVLAHELTHALWAWLMGAHVSGMSLSKKGGMVVLSESNILITLAPYFFPLYTVVVLILHGALSLFFDMSDFELFWLALVGLTWAFHITFTLGILMERQTDILEYGHMLSYPLIFFFNVLGIGLWIVAVSSATLEEFVARLCADIQEIGHLVLRFIDLIQ